CQYGGQAGRKAFVRQNCSRRHPRRPERVCVHRASLTRYQSLLSATPFLLSTICLMGRSHQLTEVMGNAQDAARASFAGISTLDQALVFVTTVKCGATEIVLKAGNRQYAHALEIRALICPGSA